MRAEDRSGWLLSAPYVAFLLAFAAVISAAERPRLAVLTAQRTVRAALRRRGYPVSRLRCRRLADRRVTCALSADRRGKRLSGAATVMMRAADRRVRYVLRTRLRALARG